MKNIIVPINSRLKDIRTYEDYTQKHIANILSITQSVYARWETNITLIPLKHLIKLSEFYDLNIDYLLGLTETKVKNNKIDINLKTISTNIKKICKENKLSVTEFANILNVSSPTIYSYLKEEILIKTFTCYDIARNFNISVDWLLGNSNNMYIN